MFAQPKTELDVTEVRKELPVLEECVYLNAGTAGIAANPVIQRLVEEVGRFEQKGELVYSEMQARMDAARTQLASHLGASADELAFTRNATDGINLVVWGIEWKPDDEVVISDEEHPAMNDPWHYLQMRGGPRVRVFKVDPDPEQTLHNIEALVSPHTRMIASSHVSCVSGTRIPAPEICALASQRGILTLLDGAQAVGQFAIDLSAMGCDFYASNGHKWLHGPKGTGFLYVRRNLLDTLKPTHVGAGSFERQNYPAVMQLAGSARRYEYGTRSYGTYAALPAALDWLEGLGWDRVEQRMRHLSLYLKERLREVPGTRLVSPWEWDHSSALVTFAVEGIDTERVKALLWEAGRVRCRIFLDRPFIRISTAYFNTEEELDLLVSLLKMTKECPDR